MPHTLATEFVLSSSPRGCPATLVRVAPPEGSVIAPAERGPITKDAMSVRWMAESGVDGQASGFVGKGEGARDWDWRNTVKIVARPINAPHTLDLNPDF
jgi:hypothetical protein